MAKATTPSGPSLAKESLDIEAAIDREKSIRALNKVLTPSTLKNYLEFAIADVTPKGRAKKMMSVMIWGSAGVGKTDVIRQLSESLGARLVALHLPQYDPTDVKGIVVRLSDDTIKWVPSSYLPGMVEQRVLGSELNKGLTVNFKFPYAENIDFRISDGKKFITDKTRFEVIDARSSVAIGCAGLEPNKHYTVRVFEKAVLFLDEISAADIEVQKAALQLVLDRRVGEYDLPITCPVLAAGNGDNDGAFTNPMSGPLSNRFNHVRLVPSLVDWIGYEIDTGNANADTIAFLSAHGMNYFHRFHPEEMTDGNNGFPTPRSWSGLAAQLNVIEDFPKFSSDDEETLIVGQIGKTIGASFIGFREVRTKLPDMNAIFRNEDVRVEREFDTPSQYMIAIMLALRLGSDIYKAEYVDKGNGGTQKWQTARDGYMRFIVGHLPRDIQYLSVTMLQHHMKVEPKSLMGPEFRKYTDEMVKMQRNIGGRR